MVPQKERRKSRRWDCVLPCRCEADNFRSDGMIVNLSYGGAGITGTDQLPAKTTELLLTIRPLTDKVGLRSKVVWVNPEDQGRGQANFGVEFTESPEETKGKLRRFFPSSLDW